MQKFFLQLAVLLVPILVEAQSTKLPKPTSAQYNWHERERSMFIHFGIATWMGTEYDMTGKFDLSRINPTLLNTDQWYEVAKSCGAKQIIFVAKHVGSFCWWATEISNNILNLVKKSIEDSQNL